VAYTAPKPALTPASSVLRTRIPGWGVDLDAGNRPAVPKEQWDPGATGAHWEFPERQVERYPREKSVEHRFLTPVFGTVCPPRGISGAIRRYAYRFSEARVAHWVLLMFADRLDVIESGVKAFLSGRPDNVLAERGLKTELTRHGIRSRFGRGRADVRHQPLDILLFAGAGFALAGIALGLRRAWVRAA
jgi:hypothetical protein